MDLLITDVTEMGQGNYCVAGWNHASNRMIRPLPGGGNWTGTLLGQHGIAPGKVILIDPSGASNGIFPHRTDDTRINPATIQTSDEIFMDWLGGTAPLVAADLATGFGGHLKWNSVWNGVRQGVHTIPRVQTNSLVAIRVPKANLSFSEVFDKLKATVNDGQNEYQLAVSSKALKEAWRAGGLAEVENSLPARNEVHVRVGLARPFKDQPKCFAMLNGVL